MKKNLFKVGLLISLMTLFFGSVGAVYAASEVDQNPDPRGNPQPNMDITITPTPIATDEYGNPLSATSVSPRYQSPAQGGSQSPAGSVSKPEMSVDDPGDEEDQLEGTQPTLNAAPVPSTNNGGQPQQSQPGMGNNPVPSTNNGSQPEVSIDNPVQSPTPTKTPKSTNTSNNATNTGIAANKDNGPRIIPVDDSKRGLPLNLDLNRNIDLKDELDDLVVEYLAEELDISEAKITKKLDAGKTFEEIIIAQGYTAAEADEILEYLRAQALEDLVDQSHLTQDQADRMQEYGFLLDGWGDNWTAEYARGYNQAPY